MTNKIQIKRSSISSDPGTALDAGELAYSYNSGKLFIGSSSGPGSNPITLLGGNTGDINWVGITAGDGLTGTRITSSGYHEQTLDLYVNSSKGLTIDNDGKLSIDCVQSVNGVTGAVADAHIGLENLGDVNSDNLSSEYVIAVDPDVTETHGYKSVSSLLGDYVSTFNGSTGAVTGVSSFNTETGAVDVTSSTLHVGGLSADSGVTASQYNLGWTNIPLSSGSITDGAMLVHDGDTDTMQKWIHGAKKTIGFFIDGDGAAIATGVKLDALTQVDQYWTIESVRLYCQEGVVAPDTTTISLYKTTDIEDSEANIESGATQLTLNGALTTSLSISNKSGTEYEKQTGPPTGGTYTLEPDEWIFPKILANTSAQKIKIFIELKATTI